MESEQLNQGRQAQILQTAAMLFSKQGYVGTSMRQLAEEIGIEAASIYSHFPSKEALLSAIAWELADAFKDAVEPLYKTPLRPDEKLCEMLRAHIGVIARYQHAAGISLTEWRHLSDEKRASYLQRRDTYEQMFRNVLDDGIRQDVFMPMDPKLVSLVMLSATNMTAHWLNQQGPTSVEKLSHQIANLLLGAIHAPTVVYA